SAVLYLESMMGQENVHTLAMNVVSVHCCHVQKQIETRFSRSLSFPAPPQFLQTAIRFLAEGAASGLNVIAVYVTEILRVTGFDGGYQDGFQLRLWISV
ncbi:hypothetical protein GOODEAATRI_015987, partial [Goodea atripinnis]